MTARSTDGDARVRRTRADVARIVLDILTSEGATHITHPHVAARSGYSKTTIYTHWPTRTDLLVVALDSIGAMPHGHPSGDRRTRLAGELRAFRDGIADHGLATILMVLAEWGAGVEDIAAIRDRIVTDGQHVVRELLGEVVDGARLEAAVQLLVGAVLCPAVMHDSAVDDETIDTAVEIVLTGLQARA